MLRKLLRILGFLIGCGVVCAYICYASHLAQQHRAEQRVKSVVISMSDSTETQLFATSEQMRRQLQRGKFAIENEPIESVDVVEISNYIARNGFVSDADVYVTYSGEMYIDVKQHKPIARLLCGGLNNYITREGYTFASPSGSAYYASVVTGGYKPLFVPKGSGTIEAQYRSLMATEEERLAKLGKEFEQLKGEYRLLLNEQSELQDDKKRKFFESKESCEQRRVGIDAELAKCNEQLRQLDTKRSRLEKRRVLIEQRKKKLHKKYDDFRNLINFVGAIREDSFWGAEIVQFVADTTSVGDMSLRLVPRSGDFVIEFGTLAEQEYKMDKLQEFYDKGLSQFGWDRYKIVDLRYKRQVICVE